MHLAVTLLLALAVGFAAGTPGHAVPAVKQNASMVSVRTPPDLAEVAAGSRKFALSVTAGAQGAPDGFTVWWMRESDYLSGGWHGLGFRGEAIFREKPIVNTWGVAGDFLLNPHETAVVELGDLLDETRVFTNWRDELHRGTRYVVTAFASGGRYNEDSALADPVVIRTRNGFRCHFTRETWTENPHVWPIQSTTLGSRTYDKDEMLAILQHGSTENGLVVLARQLIAARLNVANTSGTTSAQSAAATADGLISHRVVPPVGGDSLPLDTVVDVLQDLDDFNHGLGFVSPCSPVQVELRTWSTVKSVYR